MMRALKAIGFALAFTVVVIALLFCAVWLSAVGSEQFGGFAVFCAWIVVGLFLCGLGCYADITSQTE